MKNIFEELHIGHMSFSTGEFILNYQEFMTLIDFIFTHKTAIILGGDVLTESDQYTYSNWYYNSDASLSRDENIINSCLAAKEYLERMNHSASLHYIVVLDNQS